MKVSLISRCGEPAQGYMPFLEAAAAGYEGINVNSKAKNGHTTKSPALMYGHMKIVSLPDNHILGPSHPPLRSEPGLSHIALWLHASHQNPVLRPSCCEGSHRTTKWKESQAATSDCDSW